MLLMVTFDLCQSVEGRIAQVGNNSLVDEVKKKTRQNPHHY